MTDIISTCSAWGDWWTYVVIIVAFAVGYGIAAALEGSANA